MSRMQHVLQQFHSLIHDCTALLTTEYAKHTIHDEADEHVGGVDDR